MFPALALVSKEAFVAQTASPYKPFDVQTTLLLLLAIGFVYVTSRLVHVSRRVALLESGSGKRGDAFVRAIPEPDALPKETVAVIAAAIHTTLCARYRILSIGMPCPHRQVWSQEGRRQVFQSRQMR